MSFLPPVNLGVMSQGDVMAQANNLQTPIGAYLGSSLEEGFIPSLLGEARRPAPPLIAQPGQEPAPNRFDPWRRTDAAQQKALGAPIDEPTFKASPNYRPNIPWQPGMTEARAAALASDYDATAWRQNLYSKYQGNVFGKAAGIAAQFLGGAASPENYVQLIGPEMKAAMISRLGTVGGHAAEGALSNLGVTALVEPSIAAYQRDRGQDYGLAEITADLLFGTAIGGAAGALHGVGARMFGARAAGPAVVQAPAEPAPVGERVAGEAVPGEGKPPQTGIGEPAAVDVQEPASAFVDSGVNQQAPDLTRSPRPAGDVLTPPVLARETDALNAAADALSRGEPVDVGHMVPDRAEPEPGSYIDVFHGTPHSFEAFDSSKIGTGEGNQAFGHGLYFAEEHRIGDYYRSVLSGPAKAIRVGDETVFDAAAGGVTEAGTRAAEAQRTAIAAVANYGYVDRAIESLHENAEKTTSEKVAAGWRQAAEWLTEHRDKVSIDAGNLYGVRLHVRPDELLHWDKPLSEQSAHVKAALNVPDVSGAKEELARVVGQIAAVKAEKTAMIDAPDFTRKAFDAIEATERRLEAERETLDAQINKSGREYYQELHKDLGSDAAASAALRDAGIPGIRYLDAGSRGPSEAPTHNIVLFDPSRAEITHVNDRAVERPIPPPPSVVEAAPRVGKAGDELKTFAEDAGLEGYKAPTLEEQAKAEEAKATGKPAPEPTPLPLDGELQALRDAGRLTPEDEASLREAEQAAKDQEATALSWETLGTCVTRHE